MICACIRRLLSNSILRKRQHEGIQRWLSIRKQRRRPYAGMHGMAERRDVDDDACARSVTPSVGLGNQAASQDGSRNSKSGSGTHEVARSSSETISDSR